MTDPRTPPTDTDSSAQAAQVTTDSSAQAATDSSAQAAQVTTDSSAARGQSGKASRGRPSEPVTRGRSLEPRDIGVRIGPVMTEEQFAEYRKNKPNVKVIAAPSKR